MDQVVKPSALNKIQRQQALSQDLAWSSEGAAAVQASAHSDLVIKSWSGFPIPQRVDQGAYWTLQSEKEKRFYAIIDAFAQNNGQLGITDARFVNLIKLMLLAFAPIEYAGHRSLSRVARELTAPAVQFTAGIQSADNLRHFQLLTHAASHYNKYFNGLDHSQEWFDAHWFLATAKSYADDISSAGAWETWLAMTLGFGGVISPVLYAPLMSGGADNGDLSIVTAGFAAQSDSARHLAWGLEVIRFLAEQDPTNVPVLQAWIDKWLWRSFKLTALVAIMQDYMLPKRSMSWQESWTIYVERPMAAAFESLNEVGLHLPAHWGLAIRAKQHSSHQTWLHALRYSATLPWHVWVPDAEETAWLSNSYPGGFDAAYRSHLEAARQQLKRNAGEHSPRYFCATCCSPLMDLAQQSGQVRTQRGFCSLPCQEIFNAEPKKQVQQEAVIQALSDKKWPIEQHAGFGLFVGSQDEMNFKEWGGGHS